MNLYTARQLAVALGISPRAVRGGLDRAGATPAGVCVERGNETAAYNLETLPASFRQRLDARARRLKYRTARALLEYPARPWQPPIPPAQIDSADWDYAAKLRAVLQPELGSFTAGNPSAPPERDARIARAYGDAFERRCPITPRHARRLFLRAIQRDAGMGDWARLALYLPDAPREKPPTAPPAPPCLATAELPALAAVLAQLPGELSAAHKADVWHVALNEFVALQARGTDPAAAAQRVRTYLAAHAPWLARTRKLLWQQWEYRLEKHAAGQAAPDCQADGRARNGQRAKIPQEDVDRLRWSAAFKNGARIDCAWHEEYPRLSAKTRGRGSQFGRCPRAVRKAVNRELVKGLVAYQRGPIALARLTGTVDRDYSRTCAMDVWTMDDLTANVEVFARGPDGEVLRNAEGRVSLFQPQVILVQDGKSRKLCGWAASLDKGPTARLVTAAFRDAVKRQAKVPHHVRLENGMVFGRASAIVGKSDPMGAVIVAGLARFGCRLSWYLPHSPTSKGELEGALEALQRRMERLPGYTGRNQRFDAPELFKRQQRDIRADKLDPAAARFEYGQFLAVFAQTVADYNATPQRGHLADLSPNDAFDRFQNTANPPIALTPDLLALLTHARHRVTVKLDGVRFRDCGREIKVRGGRLPEFIGRELWAFLDTPETQEIIFMTLDFAEVFTEPVCGAVDYNEAVNAPASGALAEESRKVGQQRRAVKDAAADLLSRFGDPRADELTRAQIADPDPRELPARVPVVDPIFADNLKRGVAQVQAHRAAATARRSQADQVRALARKAGLESFADEYAALPNGLEILRSLANEQTDNEKCNE